MKILVDSKIKHLFYTVALIFFSFLLLSFFLFTLDITQTAGISLILFLMTGIAVVGVMFLYFNDQYKTMENAISQIKDYTAGNPAARIECDKEGELNRLFHEVNALVAILNAHAENEERAKRFMKDTLSDISHQLKTPLAALNIYNGIIQQEAGDAESIQEFAALSEQELERIEGAWEAIESRLKAIAAEGGNPWLEIIYTGSELISDLRDRVEALTAGADMEVLRIKNARIMERALERDDDADTLDALDVYEVFERCLAAHGVPDEQRPDLRLAYRETVASFLEEAPHA